MKKGGVQGPCTPPLRLAKRSLLHRCDAHLNVWRLAGSDRLRALHNWSEPDGPWYHAIASLLAPFWQRSPTGPLAVNLPAAEGGVGLLENHRHLLRPVGNTPNPSTGTPLSQGTS